MPFEPTTLSLTHSLRNAVIDEITPNMVAISASIVGKTVHVRAHFINEIAENDHETFSVITSQVIADFPEGYLLHGEVKLLLPGEEPVMLDCWGFLRQREPHC